MASSACSRDTISAAITSAFRPLFSTAVRASSRRVAERPTMATSAPTPASAAQVRTPIPPDPPPTIATRPSSRNRCSSLVMCASCWQRGQLVPQRRGVQGLNVVHHVPLADIDRIPLGEVHPGYRLFARPALSHGVRNGVEPLEQHGALRGEVPLRCDGAVARNHVVDVERLDNVQGGYPLVDVRGHEPRLAL